MNKHMKTMRQISLFGFIFTLFKRKDGIMKRSHGVLFGSMVVLVLCLIGFEGRAEALPVTSLDFTSGAANWDGRHAGILDRLFAQDGSITMGSYQSMSDIVDPISMGHKTYSLFTSGLQGEEAPWATIDGMSIKIDLNSLFLGSQRGDELRAWNIGGVATGLFNPQTSEFSVSWQHLFHEGAYKENHGSYERSHDRMATFFLQGTADVAQAPVPLSSSLMFFGIGLALMGGLLWRKSSGALAETAS
jgi:hypothetical protein